MPVFYDGKGSKREGVAALGLIFNPHDEMGYVWRPFIAGTRIEIAEVTERAAGGYASAEFS